jgi:hypothetical protein
MYGKTFVFENILMVSLKSMVPLKEVTSFIAILLLHTYSLVQQKVECHEGDFAYICLFWTSILLS